MLGSRLGFMDAVPLCVHTGFRVWDLGELGCVALKTGTSCPSVKE